MENNLFTNAHILAWLQYFSDQANVVVVKLFCNTFG